MGLRLYETHKKKIFFLNYYNLLSVPARESKQDTRLRTSGKLIKFRFYGKDHPPPPSDFLL